MKDVADALAETREFIEKKGWCRGNMVAVDGRVCTVGGILYSQNWTNRPLNAWEVEAVSAAIVRVLPPQYARIDAPTSAVMQWNDYTCRSQQQVLDVLAHAEKVERLGFDPDASN